MLFDQLHRREFITLLGGAAVAWPLGAGAQSTVARIGFLRQAGPDDKHFDAFRRGLRAAGYIEGQNVVIEQRYAAGAYDQLRQLAMELVRSKVLGCVEGKDFIIEWRSVEGRYERFPELAAELVRLKVDVFVTGVTAALPAVKQATSKIPIVMAYSTDPVGNGLVASLVHPGGNITGLSELTTELDAKAMEMLKEVVPQATRIGVLCESHDALAGTWLAVGQARWRKTRTRAPHGVRGNGRGL